MPNHLHAILVLTGEQGSGDSASEGPESGPQYRGRGGSRAAPTSVSVQTHKPLGRLIGAFKTVSTRQMNRYLGVSGNVIWQRNCYEHIVRGRRELKAIEQYIHRNPDCWPHDNDNPGNW